MEANVLGTAFGGVLLLVLIVLWIVFCVMLVIAPLMIWRWSKNTCAAIEALKASVTALERHLLAAHTQSLTELRLIREASKPAGRQPRPPTIPPTVPPPEAIAVCPECGAVFGFDAKVSEVDVVCPECQKPFHIH
jgi:hypothetical protein